MHKSIITNGNKSEAKNRAVSSLVNRFCVTVEAPTNGSKPSLLQHCWHYCSGLRDVVCGLEMMVRKRVTSFAAPVGENFSTPETAAITTGVLRFSTARIRFITQPAARTETRMTLQRFSRVVKVQLCHPFPVANTKNTQVVTKSFTQICLSVHRIAIFWSFGVWFPCGGTVFRFASRHWRIAVENLKRGNQWDTPSLNFQSSRARSLPSSNSFLPIFFT